MAIKQPDQLVAVAGDLEEHVVDVVHVSLVLLCELQHVRCKQREVGDLSFGHIYLAFLFVVTSVDYYAFVVDGVYQILRAGEDLIICCTLHFFISHLVRFSFFNYTENLAE